MDINDITTEDGKTYAEVTEGGQVVYRTPSYYTVRMAVADAVSWVAFHGPAAAITIGQIKAYRAGLAMRAQMDVEATVTVSSGTHVLPWDMASGLLEGSPDPRHTMPGTMGARMRARQKLFSDAASLLGIGPVEARTLPRLLRANKG
jgi:hypothetical protein